MAASGTVLRQIPCVFGAGVDSNGRLSPPSTNSLVKFRTLSFPRIRLQSRCNGFKDKGSMVYYNESPKPGEKKQIKKKLKMLKCLTEDLDKYSKLGFAEDSNLAGEDEGKIIKEAKEVLLNQLEKLKLEEKELKKKAKMEKVKFKDQNMGISVACESSSSSSSESSDSECDEVIDMNRLRNKEPLAQPMRDESSLVIESATTSTLTVSPTQEGQGSSVSFSSSMVSASSNEASAPLNVALGKRIEVCMGKKCMKSGAPTLLEEFERVVNIEGAVVGCKCLGKCKDGPNVRVSNSLETIQNEGMDVSVRSVANNPLCIGVGLEDVGVIVANLFSKDGNEEAALGLTPAS